MKRLRELRAELDVERKKRDLLEDKITTEMDTILAEERRVIKLDHARFIRTKLPLQRKWPLFMTHVPVKRGSKKSTAPISTIFDCISIPEMAHIILDKLGPYELFAFSRVSKATVQIVEEAFVFLAPYYFIRYSENRGGPVGDLDEDCALALSLVTAFGLKNGATRVTLGNLFAMCAHFFQQYRGYQIKPVYPIENDFSNWHIDYCFLEHWHDISKKNPRYGQCVRLRDLNVYTSLTFDTVKKEVVDRWLADHEFLGTAEMESPVLRHFNYGDLCRLDLQPVTGLFDPTRAFYVNTNGEIEAIVATSAFGRTVTRVPAPMMEGGRVSNSEPFFDLLERRLRDSKGKPLYQFTNSFSAHIASISVLSNK